MNLFKQYFSVQDVDVRNIVRKHWSRSGQSFLFKLSSKVRAMEDRNPAFYPIDRPRQIVRVITVMVPFQLGGNNYSSPDSMTSSPFLPRIREAAKTHKLVEQELAHSVNATALVLTEAKLSSPEVRRIDGGAAHCTHTACHLHSHRFVSRCTSLASVIMHFVFPVSKSQHSGGNRQQQ